jgi:hypothetical protein
LGNESILSPGKPVEIAKDTLEAFSLFGGVAAIGHRYNTIGSAA